MQNQGKNCQDLSPSEYVRVFSILDGDDGLLYTQVDPI